MGCNFFEWTINEFTYTPKTPHPCGIPLGIALAPKSIFDTTYGNMSGRGTEPQSLSPSQESFPLGKCETNFDLF